jgi:hypothetical protein
MFPTQNEDITEKKFVLTYTFYHIRLFTDTYSVYQPPCCARLRMVWIYTSVSTVCMERHVMC